MHYVGTDTNGRWVKVTDLKYKYKGNQLQIEVPRNLLKLMNPAMSFDFHWCDNPLDLKKPISLCIEGDNAPNRRFNYRFMWSE